MKNLLVIRMSGGTRMITLPWCDRYYKERDMTKMLNHYRVQSINIRVNRGILASVTLNKLDNDTIKLDLDIGQTIWDMKNKASVIYGKPANQLIIYSETLENPFPNNETLENLNIDSDTTLFIRHDIDASEYIQTHKFAPSLLKTIYVSSYTLITSGDPLFKENRRVYGIVDVIYRSNLCGVITHIDDKDYICINKGLKCLYSNNNCKQCCQMYGPRRRKEGLSNPFNGLLSGSVPVAIWHPIYQIIHES